MRGVTWTVAGALVLGAGVALAADAALRVRKLGAVEVRWNSVGWREDLWAQLQPGLTWRLGKDAATRLSLEGMALVADEGVLLPGEQTLNLRYWALDRWQLVVFAEDDWKWDPARTQLGAFRAVVGTDSDPPRVADQLVLSLRETTRGKPLDVVRPAVTGEEPGLRALWEVPDDCEYEGELRARWEAIPRVELLMRFGPHLGCVGFEPVKTRELRGSVGDGDDARALRVVGLDLHEPQVRAAFLEDFEGEIPVGVLFAEGGPAAGLLLAITGGEAPFLSFRTRDGEDAGDMLVGERSEGSFKKSPVTVFAALEGSRLTVTVAPWVYAFDLADRP